MLLFMCVCERRYVCVWVGVRMGVGVVGGAACNRLWVTVGPSVVIQTESNTQLEKNSPAILTSEYPWPPLPALFLSCTCTHTHALL